MHGTRRFRTHRIVGNGNSSGYVDVDTSHKGLRKRTRSGSGHETSGEFRAKVRKECTCRAHLEMTSFMKAFMKVTNWTIVLFATGLVSTTLMQRGAAQDQQEQDDPPSRVARLGYMQGSISFQPAGESEWVEAAQNRPLTTGDKIWADKDSRAELH